MTDAHGLDGRAHATLQPGDHLFNFFSGLLGALGEGAHFIGNHRKPSALLTRTRSLDGSVERQQVSLLCDAFDHVQHTADRRAVTGQLIDHQHRLINLTGEPGNAALL